MSTKSELDFFFGEILRRCLHHTREHPGRARNGGESGSSVRMESAANRTRRGRWLPLLYLLLP